MRCQSITQEPLGCSPSASTILRQPGHAGICSRGLYPPERQGVRSAHTVAARSGRTRPTPAQRVPEATGGWSWILDSYCCCCQACCRSRRRCQKRPRCSQHCQTRGTRWKTVSTSTVGARSPELRPPQRREMSLGCRRAGWRCCSWRDRATGSQAAAESVEQDRWAKPGRAGEPLWKPW